MNYNNFSTRLVRQGNVPAKPAPEQAVVSLESVRDRTVLRVRKVSTLRRWECGQSVAMALFFLSCFLFACPLQAQGGPSEAGGYITRRANISGVIIVVTSLTACGFACWCRTRSGWR
ncbi:MAG: hypothetical protein V4710_12500 [Verrucomicrobiota bacterium]